MYTVMKELDKVFSRGLLANVFRISRLAGVAPYVYTRNGPVISKSLTVYGYCLVTFINVSVIAGFAIDLQTDPSRSLRTSTPTSCIVWVSNVTIVIMIASAGVYQGSGRFATNINTLKQMIEIKTFIGLKAESYSDSNNSLSVTFMSSALCFLLVTDLFSWVKEAIYSDKDVLTLIMYSFLYYEYILILLIQLQFILLAWELRFILKNINEELKKKTNNALSTKGKSLTRYLYPSDSIGMTTLNNYVVNRAKCKSLLKPESKLLYRTCFTDESKDGDLEVINGGNIRNTSIAYGLVCDVLREINDNYGIVLLFVVLSFFLQLIITPYYMLTALYTSVDWRINLLFQCFWCIFHICNMILVVEPCHRTQQEIDETQILVSLILRSETINKFILSELDLFYKQLTLNRPSYTPMGMCTMSRPLMVTIIGAVTTYLVIVFQFRTFELHLKH